MSNEYNGWTNYETWVWNLWIDNDQGWQEMVNEWATSLLDDDPEHALYSLADMLREQAESMQEETIGLTGPLTDLLSSAIGGINFSEIATSVIERVQE